MKIYIPRGNLPQAIGIAAVLLLISFYDLIWRLAQVWVGQPDYGHGFFVPVVACGFFYVRREALSKAYRLPRSSWAAMAGGGLIVTAFGLRTLGLVLQSSPIEGLSIVPLSIGIFLLLFGWRGCWIALPGCLFLALMVPIPDFILFPFRARLQLIATQISVFSLQTLGLPAMSQGNVIVLPEAEIGVAEACSGLRMVLAFTALISAMVMFVKKPLTEKAILWSSILPIAIAVNAWRVVVVAIATHFRPSIADSVHDIAGFAMMFIAIGLFWLLQKFLSLTFLDPSIGDTQTRLDGPRQSSTS